MTPEERKEKERRLKELKLERLRRQRDELAATEADSQPEAVRYDEENRNRDRARMALQGATFGLADEIGSGLSAVGREVGSWVGLADEGTIADRYSERQDRLYEEMDAYREAHPYEAMGAEMAGGVLTGGLGAGRAAAGIGARALGRTIAARQAAAPSAKRTLGILAGESALAGAGSAQGGLEERLKGAALGTAYGLPLGAGAAGAGKVFRGIARDRAPGVEMGKGENFLPLHLVSDGKLGRFYREFIGRTYGGGEKLREQGAAMGNRLARTLARREERLAGALDTEKAATKAAEGRGAVAKQKYLEGEMMPLEAESVRIQKGLDDAADTLARRSEEIDLELQGRVDEIEAGIIPSAGAKVAEDVDSFRRAVARESLPEAAGELRDKVAQMGPVEAREAVNGWWAGQGFAEPKAIDYDWQKTVGKIVNELDRDPDMAIAMTRELQGVPAMAAKIQAARIRPTVKTEEDLVKAVKEIMADMKTIDGESMMSIRNVFARNANLGKGWKGGRQGAMKRLFDDVIEDGLEKQIGQEAVDRYRDQLTRWGTSRTFDSAVDSAWAARGEFDEKNFLNAMRIKQSGRPMTEEAWALGERRAGITERAKATARAETKAARREAAAGKRTARAERTEAGRGLRAAREALERQKTSVQERAEGVRRRAIGRDRMRRNAAGRVQKVRDQLDQAKEQARRFVMRSPAENTSGLSAMLTTEELSMLPQMTPFGKLGTAVDLLGGSLVASQLARPGVQRTLMGQTAGQRALAETLRRGAPLTRAATRGVSRTAGLEAGSNIEEEY